MHDKVKSTLKPNEGFENQRKKAGIDVTANGLQWIVKYSGQKSPDHVSFAHLKSKSDMVVDCDALNQNQRNSIHLIQDSVDCQSKRDLTFWICFVVAFAFLLISINMIFTLMNNQVIQGM